MGMFDFFQDIGNYDTRKIADKFWYKGIGVSTAYTSDEGYETALLDNNGVHPVERYKSKKESIIGNKKWINKVKKGIKRVTKLGGLGGLIDDREIKLLKNSGNK